MRLKSSFESVQTHGGKVNIYIQTYRPHESSWIIAHFAFRCSQVHDEVQWPHPVMQQGPVLIHVENMPVFRPPLVSVSHHTHVTSLWLRLWRN